MWKDALFWWELCDLAKPLVLHFLSLGVRDSKGTCLTARVRIPVRAGAIFFGWVIETEDIFSSPPLGLWFLS